MAPRIFHDVRTNRKYGYNATPASSQSSSETLRRLNTYITTALAQSDLGSEIRQDYTRVFTRYFMMEVCKYIIIYIENNTRILCSMVIRCGIIYYVPRLFIEVA